MQQGKDEVDMFKLYLTIYILMIGCPLAWKFNCIKPFFLQSGKSSLVPRPSHRPIFDSLHPYDGNIFTKDVDRHRNKRYAKVLYKFLAMDMEGLHIKA